MQTKEMSSVIQHIYKFSSVHGGLLYAWFPSMHTRVDIVLCGRQGEEGLMLVVGSIHEMLCRLEKMANYYDAESELAYLNRTAATGLQSVSKELYDMLAFVWIATLELTDVSILLFIRLIIHVILFMVFNCHLRNILSSFCNLE